MLPEVRDVEEVVGRSGSEHQGVVRDCLELGVDFLAGEVDASDVSEAVLHAADASGANFATEWKAYTGGLEAGGRHLIEERREGMVVVAVDESHVPELLVEGFREVQTCESAPYDNEAGTGYGAVVVLHKGGC